MVSAQGAQAVNPLRVVTQRLSTTPVRQLPHVAPFLATTITDSRDTFRNSQNENNSRSGSESSVLVHKLKAQLSTLLQDKSLQARFSAVILLKATIEVGGWNMLQEAGPWARGMIGILGVSNFLHDQSLVPQ